MVIGIVLLLIGLGLVGYSFVESGGFFGGMIYRTAGGILAFNGLVWLLVSTVVRGGRRRRAAQVFDLAQRGRPAQVQVVALTDTGVTINDNPRVQLRLAVTTSDGQRYDVSQVQTVSRLAIPRVGDVHAALVDPEDPTKVVWGPEVAQLGVTLHGQAGMPGQAGISRAGIPGQAGMPGHAAAYGQPPPTYDQQPPSAF